MFATFSMISLKAPMIHGFSRVYLYSFVMLFIYVILSLFIAIILDTYVGVLDWTHLQGFTRVPFALGTRSSKNTTRKAFPSLGWTTSTCPVTATLTRTFFSAGPRPGRHGQRETSSVWALNGCPFFSFSSFLYRCFALAMRHSYGEAWSGHAREFGRPDDTSDAAGSSATATVSA